MKIRDGFVSNSSSSSFILIGVKTASVDADLLEKCGFDYAYTEGDDELVGVKCRVSDYEVDSMSMKDVEDAVQRVKGKFGEDADIQIFFGQEYC